MSLFNFGVDPTSTTTSWRELTVFSIYRLFLTIALFSVFYFKLPPEFLGASEPDLYSKVSLLYSFTALVFVILTVKRVGRFEANTRTQLVLDIIFITLIINASGGLQTGLGSLLVVVVVAGGALIPGRLSVFIAAIATLSVLLEVSYSQIVGDGVTKYSHAGMLGATFFATALLAQMLTQKMKTSQVLAEQRAQDVAKLAVLNEHIISSMQTGILVVDVTGRVTLTNQSARTLLGINKLQKNYGLKAFSAKLVEQLSQWKHRSVTTFEPFQPRPELSEVLARFTALDSGETLIYLDNTSELAQQAQQLKLASLGRLTASIAHEIRNPLGAISHAGELLAENHHKNAKSIKLTDIIQRHSARVNGIIETILHMSRRKAVEPTVVILALWLEKFINEFCDIKHINKKDLELNISASLAKVSMDPEQLHQVIWNLLENAWDHSEPDLQVCRVEVKLFSQDDEVIIDICDNGKGVSEKMQEHLFEPFHSDRQGGTGLGLYLARELCQANGARLNYLANESVACFRVSFPIEKQETLQ